jgi:hypothetical protein
MMNPVNSGPIDDKPTKRKLPLASLVILGFLLALAIFSSRYYDYFFRGPFPIDDAGLDALAGQPGNGGLLSYVELKNRELVPTGVTEITKVNGRETASDPYFMTRVGERMMIVQAKTVADGRHLVGPIYRVPDSVEKEVIARVVERQPELRDKFLPVMINANAAFRVIGYIGLAFCVPTALICLFHVARAVVRM